MKKIILGVLIIFLTFGCRSTDSIMFKEEYESLNVNSEYIKVNISSDNPFIYITDEALAKKLENKEDMVVLFGYSKSNDTRNILDNLLKVCNKLNIKPVYYLDILDIRDEKEIENGEVKIIKEGSSSYKRILEILGDNLDDYIIDGEIVGTRIYAPNILVVKNKNIEGVVTGISYLETEEEKREESYNIIYQHLEKYINNTCDMGDAC